MLALARLAATAWRRGTVPEAEACTALPRLGSPAAALMAAAESRWAAERERSAASGRPPRLGRVVWAATARPFCLGLALLVVRGSSNAFTLPLLVKAVVDRVTDRNLGAAAEMLVLLLLERALGMMVEQLGARLMAATVPANVAVTMGGLLALKAATPGVLGAEAAEVNPAALVGRELSMLYMRMGGFCSKGFVALPTLIAGSVTLLLLMGWSALFGVLWVLVTIRIGGELQRRAKLAEERISAIATRRLDILGNVIGAIKAIKYFTWELEFQKDLLEARQLECRAIGLRTRLHSLSTTLGKITPVTASLVTFVTYALLGNTIRAGDVFAANTVFMTMRFAVGSASVLIELQKALQLMLSRTEKFLLLPERQPLNIVQGEGEALACIADLCVDYGSSASSPACSDVVAREGPGASAGGAAAFVLRAPGRLVLARPGALTAICGAVGSGKSTLLLALVGSADGGAALSGAARCVASVGWCPQRPLIVSGTVRENVLMGRPCDDARLARCLADACLVRDLELLHAGLDEPVGERGTTLSGGQQARLALARAFYGKPRLLLLDDPLAAVDAAVGRALLQALRKRCSTPRYEGGGVGAAVALNQLQLLQSFDAVVHVEAGQVKAMGAPEEFLVSQAAATALQDVELQEVMDLDADGGDQSQAEMLRMVECLVQRSNTVQPPRAAGPPPDSKDAITWVGSEPSRKGEATAGGFVRWSVLRAYLLAPGRWFLALVLVAFVLTYALLGVRDWWLSFWADHGGSEDPVYVALFAVFGALHVAGAVLGVLLIGGFAARAGQSLHSDCVDRLLRAPMSYFDATPSGRITSRFGPDLAQMDGMMAMQIDFTMTFGFTFLMMCVAVIAKVPLMALLFVAALLVSVPVIRGLVVLLQDVKRHANNAMAPIMSNLSEVQRGAVLASTLGCTQFFISRHQAATDRWALLSSASMLVSPLAELWWNFVHLFVLAATALLTFWAADTLRSSPGLIGMYFSYAALWGLFATSTTSVLIGLLTNLTSLERLLEYKLGELPQEPPWHQPSDPAPTAWPCAGSIRFEDVALRYRAGLPRALDGFSLEIAGGEKLGIVGRTGAGKSSVTSILFRLVDCEAGRVLIDGVDILSLGVHTLRRAISMIPQEPIVMSGTVRYNLDPFCRRDDSELTAALRKAGLWPAVSLDTVAGGVGAGLSAGQRQLLTFGRTLLQDARLVVMDEPTASVDVQTDRQVQAAAREAFSGRTVVTIAHRLDTVMHCDRLAVMDAGRLAELGPPAALLGDPGSRLSQLSVAAAQMGAPAGGDTGSSNGGCKGAGGTAA